MGQNHEPHTPEQVKKNLEEAMNVTSGQSLPYKNGIPFQYHE